MNLRKTLVLLGAGAVMAGAAAGDLWSLEAPDYQVQVPCVVNAEATDDVNGDGDINGYDCAGWWYGYGFANTAKGYSLGTWSPADPTTGKLLMTDEETGEPIAGGNVTDAGLYLELVAPAGASEDPTGAGLGFDFEDPKGPRDISAKEGYILKYTATAELQLELGWDEDTYGFDSWYVVLDQATNSEVTLPWALFSKDNWATGTGKQPIETATQQAYSMKIRLKNGTTSEKTAAITVHELGFIGGTAVKTPSLANGVKAVLSGRSLAITGLSKKSVTVQVISLQGEVVARQVMSASSNTLNLANATAGVYAIKVMGHGVNMSQMMMLK